MVKTVDDSDWQLERVLTEHTALGKQLGTERGRGRHAEQGHIQGTHLRSEQRNSATRRTRRMRKGKEGVELNVSKPESLTI